MKFSVIGFDCILEKRVELILIEWWGILLSFLKAWIASFEKPKVTPNSLFPSPTGVSPYLRFGCLSPRLFYHRLTELYRKVSWSIYIARTNLSFKANKIIDKILTIGATPLFKLEKVLCLLCLPHRKAIGTMSQFGASLLVETFPQLPFPRFLEMVDCCETLVTVLWFALVQPPHWPSLNKFCCYFFFSKSMFSFVRCSSMFSQCLTSGFWRWYWFGPKSYDIKCSAFYTLHI